MGESRVSRVYAVIVKRMLSGEYVPGQALNRREIAADLGVSISPVNEAFAILQTERIVETVPRKGTFVARLDRRDLAELTHVRAALEVEAARACCGARISGRRSEMLELALAVDAAAPAGYDHLRADVVFHRSLVGLAGNRLLASIFDTVIARSLLLAIEANLAAHESPASMSHRKFVRDLCAATPETVAPLVRRNIFSGKERILDVEYDRSAVADSPLDLVLSALKETSG